MSARKERFTPGKALLLLVAAGTLGLMAVPGDELDPGPDGMLEGAVVDTGGARMHDVPVGLFDADSLALVEMTFTDVDGRYAFQSAPDRFHVVARPSLESGRVAGFAFDRERDSGRSLAIVCEPGAPTVVHVTDDGGRPLSGGSVRAYATDPAVVVSIAKSDPHGVARVLVPASAHVVALGNDIGRLAHGWYDQSNLSGELTAVLPGARAIDGFVHDEQGAALADVFVSAWDERDGWQWNGFGRTDGEGNFRIAGVRGTTHLRLADPQLRVMPVARDVEDSSVSFELPSAASFDVTTVDAAGTAVAARIWTWHEAGDTWSWGVRTGSSGTLEAAAGSAVAAQPLGAHEAVFVERGNGPAQSIEVER